MIINNISLKQFIGYGLSLIILLGGTHWGKSVYGDESSGEDDFMQVVTRKAIKRIKPSIVNIRPIYKGKKPSYEETLKNFRSQLKNQIRQAKNNPEDSSFSKREIKQKERVLNRLGLFLEKVGEKLEERHRSALRDLLLRIRSRPELLLRLMELLKQVGRGFQNRLGIKDALDFLQYVAPPPSGFSGVLLRDGYVLSSRFVGLGRNERYEINTHDGESLEAKKVGGSKMLGVSLLKISGSVPSGLQPVSLDHNTEKLRRGYWAIAVGRAPRKDQITASRGIISGVNRFQGRKIQFDALTNYSSAGGALIDIKGNFIGLITGISIEKTLQMGHNSGVTMAVRTEEIRKSLPELKAGESIGIPFLGVGPDTEFSSKNKGVRIARVVDASGAGKAGLQRGDVVVEYDGKKVEEWRDLVNAIRSSSIGDTVELKILRDGEEKVLDVRLTAREQYDS